jgi:ATP-citrate lyase alpha-subunit
MKKENKTKRKLIIENPKEKAVAAISKSKSYPQPKHIPEKSIKEPELERKYQFITTISDDRGEEIKYLGIPLSKLIEDKNGIGDIIGLLWLKRKLPKYASNFVELVIEAVADHGPCVSGAHNAIVAARAGKDLVSSVASGLLTIGPRFGGAIDEAGHYFKWGKDSGLSPEGFVNEMMKKRMLIPGIGHKVKNVNNPDKRVVLLINYARKNFPKTEYLDYVLKIEKITTSKKENLILNIDGCIGVLLVDMLKSIELTDEEISERLNAGLLNAFFVLGRTIGIIGHVIDQKLLKSNLYRVPYDDVLYKLP